MAVREYELKFNVAQDDVERLLAHPMLKPALPERRVSRLVSTYFDTPDARLRAARISLRTRCSDAGSTQTLKRAAASLVDRGEWERRDAGERPDGAWLRQTPLAGFFEPPIVAALDARFTVDVMRTTLALRCHDATIEGAIDQGAIRAHGAALPVNELELELKGGSPGALVAVARELARDLPLVLSLASKAERGRALADGSWGRPTKAIALQLDESMTTAQAFMAIVQGCLHTFLVNAALVGADGAGDDVEPVHATRIALRRLRAALDLFKPALRRHAAAAILQDVTWMAARLGHARDADVFRAEIVARAEADDAASGDQALAAVIGGQHDQAHAALRRALASSRFRLMALDLLAFSEHGVRRSRAAEAFAPFVRRRLQKRQKALVRAGRRPSLLPQKAMHDARKAAKMLRYSLEFFDGIGIGMKPKRVAALRDALQALQHSLGEVHDAEAMRVYLRDTVLRRGAPADVSPAQWQNAAAAAAHIADMSSDHRQPYRAADKAARIVARARLLLS